MTQEIRGEVRNEVRGGVRSGMQNMQQEHRGIRASESLEMQGGAG